jgi:thiol-disulfide isomerase/thioredoxin
MSRRFAAPWPLFTLSALGLLALATLARPVAAADAATAEAESGEAADPFAIPDGDAAEIHEFIVNLLQSEPQGETEAEREDFRLHAIHTLIEGSQRLLAAKPNLRQAVDGTQIQLMALGALAQIGEAGADQQYAAAIDRARGDRREPVAMAGWEAFLDKTASAWDSLDNEARAAASEEILSLTAAQDPSRLSVIVLDNAAKVFERRDDPFVKELLEASLPVLSKSKNSQVKSLLRRSNLAGVYRRLDLPGNELKVSGTLLDGSKLDWPSYRGKVVLVDFWATWCGPCREEVPNILTMYNAYHDRGFEVLGVSLDDTPEDANRYIKDNEIPWATLFPKDENQRGWDNPLARYYGISGIPTAILVGPDGRVVHMNARGRNLRAALQQLLGDPDEDAAAAGQ